MARIKAARESLKAKKLLNKAGAITPDGRNAIEGDARTMEFLAGQPGANEYRALPCRRPKH